MASDQINPARRGDEFFLRKEYEKALEAYSTAIDQHPNTADLYSKRAFTYLKLERPLQVLEDLEMCLTLDPDNDKLISRKCKALLALRRFSDAGQFLDESIGRLAQLATTKEFKALIDELNRLKPEYERGEYDLPAMIKEAKESERLENHADYIAWNKFKIDRSSIDVAGKGRGLVAKEKIEAGELLIACKAFAYCTPHGPSFASLTVAARNNLIDRPDLAEEFYDLHALPESARLEKLMEGESYLTDADRNIKRIVLANSFRAADVDGVSYVSFPPEGLWFTPSYINHTCVDRNSFYYFVGDYMFVRAIKSIEKGDEILFPYVSPSMSFEERQTKFKDVFGFDCQCRLCAVDDHDSSENKQQMEKIRTFMDNLDKRSRQRGYNPYGDIKELKIFLKDDEVVERRPQRDLNYLALRVEYELADLTYRVNAKESLRLMTEHFEVLKSNSDLLRRALEISKIMYKRQASLPGGKEEQEKWKEEARRIAKLIYGDERMADLMFKEG